MNPDFRRWIGLRAGEVGGTSNYTRVIMKISSHGEYGGHGAGYTFSTFRWRYSS